VSRPVERPVERVGRCRPLLGTFVEITAEGPVAAEALHARIDAAFACIARVHDLMSFHDPDSELSRLNAGAHRAPIAVHPWTGAVLAEAIRLGDASGGAFDPAVAPRLVRWGFLPRSPGWNEADAAGSYRDIRLLPGGRVAFVRPLQLDLGGIAKGFAVDRAAEALAGVDGMRACVDAGGDMRFVGEPPARLRVRHPRAPWSATRELAVAGPAVATSAAYFARRRYRGRRVSHLVDPHSGASVRRRDSVSVFAPSALQADALTKVVAILGTDACEALLRTEGASAIVLSA